MQEEQLGAFGDPQMWHGTACWDAFGSKWKQVLGTCIEIERERERARVRTSECPLLCCVFGDIFSLDNPSYDKSWSLKPFI